MAATQQQEYIFDWNSLGSDVECLISMFLDIKSTEALSLCSHRFYDSYIDNVPRAMPPVYKFKYIASHLLSKFESKPLSTLDICFLYSMFRRCKLEQIQDSWFKLKSIDRVKKKELVKFIKNNQSDEEKKEKTDDSMLYYCVGWKNITVAEDGRFRICIDRESNNVGVFHSINWKFVPTKLVKLKLTGCNLSFDISDFTHMPTKNALQILDLSSNKIYGDCGDAMAHFAQFTNLKTLKLAKNMLNALKIGKEHLEILPSHIEQGIELIDFSGNELENANSSSLDFASFCSLFPQVKTLQFANNHFDGKLQLNICCAMVESIQLSNNQICAITNSTTISSKLSLKCLDLSNNLLSGDIMDDIIKLLPESITELNLFNNQIKGIIDFNVIGERLPNLEKLSLNYNQIENVMNINKDCQWPSKLKLLDLSFNLIKCECTTLRWSELSCQTDKNHEISIYLNDNNMFGVFEEDNFIKYCAINHIDVSNNSLKPKNGKSIALDQLPENVKGINVYGELSHIRVSKRRSKQWEYSCEDEEWRRRIIDLEQ